MSLKRPPKITVNVKGDIPEIVKVTPNFTSDGRTLLVMARPTEKTRGWTIDATNALSRDIKGKIVIDVIRGDLYPLKYSQDDEKKEIRKTIFPFMSLDDVKLFAQLDVFKAQFGKLMDALKNVSPLLWVILIMAIISLLVSIVSIVMLNGVGQAVNKIPLNWTITNPGGPSI